MNAKANAQDGEEVNGWSAAGELITGVPQKALTMQANFKKRPGYYTIQFNVRRPVAEVGQVLQTLAEVVWSVEGNSVRRLISIGDGATISGAGQGVRVKVFDNSTLAGGLVTNQPYPVSMQVVKGTRPTQSQQPILEVSSAVAPGTTSLTPIAAGANAIFLVPENAGVTALYVAVNNTGPAALRSGDVAGIFASNAVGLKEFNYDACQQWIAVPPGAIQIQIFNKTAADPIAVTLTWGIDG